MTFIREGKRLSYEEVIKMVDELIKQNVLSELDVQELNKLSNRIVNFTEETLRNILKEQGYSPNKTKTIFTKAEQLNLLSDVSTWNKAIEMRENEEESETIEKEEIVSFISNDYLKAMRSLNKRLQLRTRRSRL